MRSLFKRLDEEPIVNNKNNIVAVVIGPDGKVKERRQWFFGKNLVTDGGDQYYAEAIVASGSVMIIAGMNLGSSAVAPAKGNTNVGSIIANGSAAISSGYPRTSDPDADNTGAGADIVTWLASFGTGVANANGIQEVAIANVLGTAATANCIMRGTVASFNKTSSDTLKVFVNHTINGV